MGPVLDHPVGIADGVAGRQFDGRRSGAALLRERDRTKAQADGESCHAYMAGCVLHVIHVCSLMA
jgi:hypothetical protein